MNCLNESTFDFLRLIRDKVLVEFCKSRVLKWKICKEMQVAYLKKKYINDLEYQILICTSWVVMSDYLTTGHMEDNQTKH